jgi:death-on-curing protein
MPYVYFPVDRAIQEHDKIIAISGGGTGIINKGLLESALIFIQDDNYYPEFHDKLTHLVYSVAMNHCFIDGNKRSSIALGAYFLELNGFGNIVPAFIVEMENTVLWVARGLVPKEMLLEINISLLTAGELTEEIKLKLAEVLTGINILVDENPH